MIAALSIALAVVAVVALAIANAKRRRFAARLAERADSTELLAEGAAGMRSPPRSAPASRRDLDLDAELARLSRALDRLAVRAAQDLAAVEAERRKLDEILAGVPEGVLVTTTERAPVYANRAFRELFDVDDDASTAELLALVRRPQVHDALGRATAGEVSPAVEIAIGGREVSVVARQLEGGDGILLTARDVTDSNRLTRMRRDFVTNLSHEIKTPLAVIRGAAETLQETGAEDAAATDHFVGRIVQQIYRLEDLLKDLLTLARVESPEASLHRQPVDLAVLCRRAVELLTPLASREGVAIEASLEPVPALAGDAKALERMVLNLVVNAIQYNRRDGHVWLRLAPDPSARGGLVLEVEDDGIGIAAVELQRIFERFYRVDKGRGRAEGGSGLGLAIVKHVVQAHGGTVEVKSQVERGTAFRVVLPLAADAASPPAPPTGHGAALDPVQSIASR